ncbi:hypothetical protein C2U70_00695 [Bradyrhizobium guangdongense]|uniref:esterase/lipase family protein n=1 Tax=Bradyrhizobium guangdongense TaxID=1325090 RepID=UPI00112CF1BC|nr:hypothetical protein [Bradyrhizobium guangdongense]TPQ42812.1 hypothetical protein C2U70_00695 [Bradyrhizobium guangdongense]
MIDDFVLAKVGPSSGVLDLIFIHGLTGDLTQTWMSPRSGESSGDYWPKWVSEDLPDVNVYALGYPASLFEKWTMREMSLYERAKATLEYLASYSFGDRPLAFVAHSLGGLLVKQLLKTGSESVDARWRKIAENIRLIVFLATPHTGSSVASALTFCLPRLSSKHVNLLRSGDSELDQLNATYRKLAPQLGIRTVPFYEMHRTKRSALIVDKLSADPGVAETELIPVDADHVSICKPANRHGLVYLSIIGRLSDLLKSVEGKRTVRPPLSLQSHRLSLAVYGEEVIRDFYVVLPFDGKTVFAIPIEFAVQSAIQASIKNVFVHLEISDTHYQHKLVRKLDSFAEARDIRLITDQGRTKHIARALFRIPHVPPGAGVLINDFIFAKESTIAPFDIDLPLRDAKPGKVSGKVVFRIPITLTLDGEDVQPLSTTVNISFRQGDIQDFKHVKRAENQIIEEMKDVRPADAVFIGFTRFVNRDGFTPEEPISEADPESLIAEVVRITPRGVEPKGRRRRDPH